MQARAAAKEWSLRRNYLGMLQKFSLAQRVRIASASAAI
jgi:hypothetical protein